MCLLRLLIVPSQAWREYGVHWVQLDEPRHLYLHSVDSLRAVAANAAQAGDQAAFYLRRA